MQNLTVELFARDKTARGQLLDDALSVSPTNPSTPTSPVATNESEPITELVQILLAAETEPPKLPKSSKSNASNDEKNNSSAPISSESHAASNQSMTPEEALTCAQIIAEEERIEAEEKKEKEEAEKQKNKQPANPEPSTTPPPLQRVPYDSQTDRLANIRAVTESMNIAAIPAAQPQEPMSFAACVRKMPSIESMSTSPSPYAKFDGKSNPFNNGPTGGFGRDLNKSANANPFANRKRYTNDFDRSDPTQDLAESFSSSYISSSKPSGMMSRTVPRGSESSSSGTMPNWWKSRSFSSATSYYPQSQRPSQFAASNKNMNNLTIPSSGHVEDLDGYLNSNSQSNAYYNRRTDLNIKKERWARMKARKRLLRRPVEDEYYEDPDLEEEILRGKGVMLNQIVQQNTSGNYEDADLLRKYRRDVAYVKEQVLKEVDGNLDAIRDLRFLLASVQTYGNIDGECMMAELAMNEFSIFSGIDEKFHSIVGPWQTENESQRRRASRHAFETHRIPLQHNIATVSKRKLIEEILGRVEPSIACHQGVKVGLYSDSCDEKKRVELNIKNNFKDPGMICDKNQRRFILVLQSELDLMVESMKHLGKTVGLHYEGFPIHHNRYVIVEAFVEAIADIMDEKVDVETMRWFSLLGQKVENAESVSPWETCNDFYCSRHSEPKSNFCASVTVGRTCLIIYRVLGSFFRRYHLKKIPTAHLGASNSIIA